jgi:hypothetical protein
LRISVHIGDLDNSWIIKVMVRIMEGTGTPGVIGMGEGIGATAEATGGMADGGMAGGRFLLLCIHAE